MAGNRATCLVLKVAVLVAVAAVLVEGYCSNEELVSIRDCIFPVGEKYFNITRFQGPCNGTMIRQMLCSAYDAAVKCANRINISRTQCRPFAVNNFDVILGAPCKLADFAYNCPRAEQLDGGDVGRQGSSGTTLAPLDTGLAVLTLGHVILMVTALLQKP